MYVAAACHSFVQSSVHVLLFLGLASILAEDIKPRASCTEEVFGYAHISKGLSSVSVLLRASVLLSAVVARLLSSKDHILFQVIRSFSMFHRDFWVITPCFIRSFSNQVKFYDSSNMCHTFPCYSVPNANPAHAVFFAHDDLPR